ncbi:hypothetical protein PT974_09431 [Cladobotryum mycophilum]|uniref:Hcy-binding domain-containing protein n=1 Tax=Cladobotryum mycophilum TaxID=491253 RepID=A0ABR0SG48_9HYPO
MTMPTTMLSCCTTGVSSECNYLLRIRDLKERIDYIALETIPRLDEILAIRRALDFIPELSSGVPFWMSCLFPNEDESLPDGSSPERAIRTMLDPGPAKVVLWGVGIKLYQSVETRLLAAPAMRQRCVTCSERTSSRNGHHWCSTQTGQTERSATLATQQWEMPDNKYSRRENTVGSTACSSCCPGYNGKEGNGHR